MRITSVVGAITALAAASLVVGSADAAPRHHKARHAHHHHAARHVAPPPAHNRVGTLRCDIDATIGLILGSTRDGTCTFQPTGRRAAFALNATVARVGFDVGISGDQVATWAVYAPAWRIRPQQLFGAYTGPSAQIAVVRGPGMSTLYGGEDSTIELQPTESTGEAGLNLAMGMGTLTLRPATVASR
jgi:hypothetical protein